MRQKIDFESLNEEALSDALEIIEHFVPELEYKLEGNELVMLNPLRPDSELGSFKFNLETGLWADFAETDDAAKGAGVISLLIYLLKKSPREISRLVMGWLRQHESQAQSADPTPERSLVQDPVPVPVPVAVPGPTRPEAVFSEAELHLIRQNVGILDTDHVYRTHAGEPIQVVVRRDLGDGRKTFRQYSKWPTADGSYRPVMKAHRVPRPLYGLEHAIPSATIVLVEGEKCVDAGRSLLSGYTVLTHSGGANGVSKADWSPVAALTNQVIIWPDFDEPGLKCAADTVAALRKTGAALIIKWLNLPAFYAALCDHLGRSFDLDEWHGKDVADVLELGVDGATVARLMEANLMDPPSEKVRLVKGNSRTEETARPVDGIRSVIGGKAYWFREKYVALEHNSLEHGPREERLCSGLRLIGSARDAGSADWSLILEVRQPDGVYQPFVLQTSRLSSPQEVLSELLATGLKLYGKQEALMAMLRAAEPSPHYLLVRENGWCSAGEYVLGPHKVTSVAQEPIYSVLADRISYQVNGSVADWNEHVGRYCGGNSRLLLFVGAALAAPLLRLLHMGSAGFHLVGPSSVGKTTAMKVGASMVGFPGEMIAMWRTTSNALEVIAAGRNDGPLLLDELAMCPAEEVDNVAYMLGNGMGKQRMGRTGQLREAKKWCVMALSTGEVTPEQHLATAGKRWRAGMEMRLASLTAAPEGGHGLFECLHDKANGVELASYLGHATSRYYGAVFRAWVDFIATSVAAGDFIAQLEQRVEQVKRGLYDGGEGQIHRAAKVFSLIQVALELATSAGILQLPDGDARWGVEVCFQAWMQQRGGDTAAEEIAILRQVSAILQRTAQSHFTRLIPGLGDSPEVQDFRREDYGYSMPTLDERGDVFYIRPAVFDQEFCSGYTPKHVKDLLRRHDYLIPGSDGGPTVTKRLPLSTSEARRYVAIRASITEAYPANL